MSWRKGCIVDVSFDYFRSNILFLYLHSYSNYYRDTEPPRRCMTVGNAQARKSNSLGSTQAGEAWNGFFLKWPKLCLYRYCNNLRSHPPIPGGGRSQLACLNNWDFNWDEVRRCSLCVVFRDYSRSLEGELDSKSLKNMVGPRGLEPRTNGL